MPRRASKPIQLHVVHIASGDLWAGAEVQLFTLCKALKDIDNMKVSVILMNPGELANRLKAADIQVIIFNEKESNGIQILLAISEWLKFNQPHVVHTHRTKENILGGIAARLNRIPSLRTIHGAPEHRPEWLKKPHKRLISLFDQLTGRYFQKGLVSVSEELTDRLDSFFPAHKLKTIHNGIDIEALKPFSKQLDSSHSFTDPIKIGLVGRLVPVKRVDIFIQIAQTLAAHHPELQAHFHIYGDGPMRGELENYSKKLGLQNRVFFEGHTTDIHRQIASLDILMITSDHEGLPMTLLEAMCIGIPVVAHNVGGISKTCQNESCCWLYKKNSADNIVSKLVECISSPQIRLERCLNARNNITLNYSAKTNASNYKKLYDCIA